MGHDRAVILQDEPFTQLCCAGAGIAVTAWSARSRLSMGRQDLLLA